jgi:hypothetical protein
MLRVHLNDVGRSLRGERSVPVYARAFRIGTQTLQNDPGHIYNFYAVSL